VAVWTPARVDAQTHQRISRSDEFSDVHKSGRSDWGSSGSIVRFGYFYARLLGRKVCEVLVKRLKPLKRGSRCPTSQLLRLALLALEQRRPKRGEEGT
jgi:hypothetical protein